VRDDWLFFGIPLFSSARAVAYLNLPYRTGTYSYSVLLILRTFM